MSTAFDPLTALLIASSTNATPIVVETQIAHGLATNDEVDIFGHLVNTNANGQWPITVVDSTHFSLTGSVGNGVGVATGAVIPYTTGGIQLPSDGDDLDAASVNAALAALGDRVGFLRKLTVLAARTYTASGTDVLPDGAILSIGIGWGSGGGGGGGAGGNTGQTTMGASGGAGGGAARRIVFIGTFAPRSSQTVVIGASVAGGTGGAPDNPGTDGTVGNDSTYGGVWTFPGASPGGQGQDGFVLNTTAQLAIPGSSSKEAAPLNQLYLTDQNAYLIAFALSRNPGEGGFTIESQIFQTASNGADQDGFIGGPGGSHGSTSTAPGGGGGGGGAAGPGGNGGTGGNGGNGHSTGGGVPGTNGGNAPANSGAGSGGGGAGGSGDPSGGGAGGAAGTSGSGQIMVLHLGAPQ